MQTELLDPSRIGDLTSLSTDELKQQLAAQLTITVESFTRIAFIVRELEERGEDLSSLRLSLLSYFRRIAHGQLSAAAVVRFAQRPDLLNRVSTLPLPDQEMLAKGGPIALVVRQGDSMTTRMIDPLELHRTQIMQVFGKSIIHSESQQIAIIEAAARPHEAKAVESSLFRIDKERGGLILGRRFFSADELLTALAQLNETPVEIGENTAINIDSAHAKCLRIQAAKRDTTMRELVVRSLRACGLLTEK